jgi:hypothetical protein
VISPARAAALAFLTAFTTLYAQVLVHRLVSLKLVNNLAFLVVSLTMLGFAVSGVLLTRWQQALLRRRSEAIVAAAALFAISMVGVSAAFAHAPAGAQWAGSRLEFLGAFLRVAPLALLYAIPFTFSGLVLGLLLASPDLPTARVYFADLLGSGAGALAVIPSIGIFGVETALMAAAAAFVVGTAALCGPRDRRVRAVTAAALALVGLAALAPGAFFDMRYPAGSVLDATRHPGSGFVLEHVAWDPVARVELTRIPTPSPQTVAWPYLVGDDARLLSQFRRLVTQNNTAFTYAPSWDGRPESLAGVDRTLYAAAYQASGIERPRVLVVGVGGGFDVLTALRSDATVDAVEVNRATVEILRHTYRDEFRAWVEDPRVRLRHAEGRHLLSTTTSSFDVIQLSGVDSVSGTPAAAHVFSENYLYTQEAFDLLLSRLSEDGIVNMMRTEYRPPREMLRALVPCSSSGLPSATSRSRGCRRGPRPTRSSAWRPIRAAAGSRTTRMPPSFPWMIRASRRRSWPATPSTSGRSATTVRSSSTTPTGGTCSRATPGRAPRFPRWSSACSPCWRSPLRPRPPASRCRSIGSPGRGCACRMPAASRSSSPRSGRASWPWSWPCYRNSACSSATRITPWPSCSRRCSSPPASALSRPPALSKLSEAFGSSAICSRRSS